MQRNLRIGLRDFKNAEGIQAAHSALRGNVADGQRHFKQCVDDVRTTAADFQRG